MLHPSLLESFRFAMTTLGVVVTIWCCWDSFLDALAMYGIEIRWIPPKLMEARWKAIIDPRYLERAADQRLSALCILHRVIGRLTMLIVQLALSTSAVIEPNAGADWKLIAQMIGVAGLTANAFTDRLERHKLIAHLKPPRPADSC